MPGLERREWFAPGTRWKLAGFYAVTIGVVAAGIFLVLALGEKLPPPVSPMAPSVLAAKSAATATGVVSAEASWWEGVLGGLKANLHHPLSALFLQILVILGASRIAGSVP